MSTTADEPQAYASFADLQRASDQLIEDLPDDEASLSDLDRKEISRRVAQFIDGAIATGAALDASTERRAAQALVDFWVAKSYSIAGETRAKPRASSKINVVLRPFDPATIESVTQQGDAFLKTLSEKDKNLAGRILLRLVRLGDIGTPASSWPAKRSDLLTLSRSRVDQLLDGLIKSGVLVASVQNSEELISLRNESLIRQWPKLHELAEERINYRSMAVNWAQTGRRNGTLIDFATARKFRSFGNLNELEQDFTNASERYSLRMYGVSLATVVVIVVTLVSFSGLKKEYFNPLIAPLIHARVKDGPTRTAADIKWLAQNGDRIEARRGSIEKMDLSGLSTNLPYFQDINFNDVAFDRANLIGAAFINSDFAAVTFREAGLNFARFEEATFKSLTSFAKADLSNARLEDVQFCQGVDFSDVKVQDASFKDVLFSDDAVPNMTNTAWWQASDWTEDQRKLLARLYPGRDVENSVQFQKDLKQAQVNIDLAEKAQKETRQGADQDTILMRKGSWMNEKAWTFATYGVVRPNDDPSMDAAKLASQALEIFDAVIQRTDESAAVMDDYKRAKASVSDTLAYILIQREELTPEQRGSIVPLLEYAKDVKGNGGILFRYSAALFASDETKALEHLKKSVRDKNYMPTHELYLMPKLLTPQFQEAFEKLRSADSTDSDAQISKPTPAAPSLPDRCGQTQTLVKSNDR